MTTTHKLENTWVFWEILHVTDKNLYNDAVRPICEFSTVEEFWQQWAFIPKPSEVFYDGKAKKYIEGRLIKSFAVFKKGINPTWEDPANANGSELVASSAFLPDIFDAFWENLVLGLIGESIDDADQICGCRVVDQTRKNNAKPTYKIELWLRTTEDTICSRIKTRLSHTLLDGDKNFSKVKLPDFDLNRHKA